MRWLRRGWVGCIECAFTAAIFPLRAGVAVMPLPTRGEISREAVLNSCRVLRGARLLRRGRPVLSPRLSPRLTDRSVRPPGRDSSPVNRLPKDNRHAIHHSPQSPAHRGAGARPSRWGRRHGVRRRADAWADCARHHRPNHLPVDRHREPASHRAARRRAAAGKARPRRHGSDREAQSACRGQPRAVPHARTAHRGAHHQRRGHRPLRAHA
jgi:hypothetical protein